MAVERLTVGAGDAREVATAVRALAPAPESVAPRVAEIVARVRAGGDAALDALTGELDLRGGAVPELRVPTAEIDAAAGALRPDVRAGIETAMTNVAAVAGLSVGDDAEVVLAQGQRILVREMPVGRAAVYAPGGRAPYPSTVVMGVVTARVAGVDDVVVCTPPRPDGTVDEVLLAACGLCGVDEVLRMGGAQAVAALAYGTERVRPVDVIVGPGNLYVQEAKVQCSAAVGIDGFAGPSDLLVVCSPPADPRLVALDLGAQAEHGPASVVAVCSDDDRLLDAVVGCWRGLAAERPTIDPAGLAVVRATDLDAALGFANAFAAEHLQLVGARAEALAPRVRAAGCLLVGAASATAFTDYVAGSNHVLPTGGAARFASSLGPRHFRRRMAEVHVDGAAAALARAGAPLARAEGFMVHAESMEART